MVAQALPPHLDGKPRADLTPDLLSPWAQLMTALRRALPSSLLFCPFCPQYSGFHYLCCAELSSKPSFPNFALSYVIELCPTASPAHPCSWPPCDVAQALHLGLQDSTGPCSKLHVRNTLFKPDLDSPPLPVCSLSLYVSAASSWESLTSFPLTFAGTCPFTDGYCLEWT